MGRDIRVEGGEGGYGRSEYIQNTLYAILKELIKTLFTLLKKEFAL